MQFRYGNLGKGLLYGEIMLSIQTLLSGSSGNLAVIKSDETTLLLDMGVHSQSRLKDLLLDANIQINAISAVIVSHCHSDHLSYAGLRMCENYGIPVLAAPKCVEIGRTLYKSHLSRPFPEYLVRTIMDGVTYLIGNIEVTGFLIPHDVPTYGFEIMVRERAKNKRVTIATDLGCAPDCLIKHFTSSDAIFIEANYNEEMLQKSNRDPKDKARVLSDVGHLSNVQSGRFIGKVLLASETLPKSITLVHLSEDHNNPNLAMSEFVEATQVAKRHLPIVFTAPRYQFGEEIII